jgi:hypothetical protein
LQLAAIIQVTGFCDIQGQSSHFLGRAYARQIVWRVVEKNVQKTGARRPEEKSDLGYQFVPYVHPILASSHDQ